MRKDGFSEIQVGAVAGAVVAGCGGLFAIGLPSTLLNGDIRYLFATPTLSLLSWLVCMPTGYLLGSQIGPPVGERLRSQRAEIIAGGCAGLVPVLIVAAYGWYLALQP